MPVSAARKQLVWVRAAGRCSLPDCRKDLLAESDPGGDPATVGHVAHIVGQSESKGPRSEHPVPGGNRNGFANLMLLCPSCHTRVDRLVHEFTVERLTRIKKDHEKWVRTSLDPARNDDAEPELVEEKLFGTVLWVEQMPRRVYTAPCSAQEAEVRAHVRSKQPEVMLPYVVRGGNLVTFVDLRASGNPFREALSDEALAEEHSAPDWWEDPDKRRWYVALLNRLLNKICGRKGLHLDREHHRYFFPPEFDEDGVPMVRKIEYIPLNRAKQSRSVAWQPQFRRSRQPKNYWEHLAVSLSFHEVASGEWVLSVRPERRFTRDGVEPLTPKGTGRRSTTRKSRMYNPDVLGEVQFWRDYLIGGRRLIAPLGGQSLILDGDLLSVDITWPRIGDRVVAFRNAWPEDDLFGSSEYDRALESDEAEEGPA